MVRRVVRARSAITEAALELLGNAELDELTRVLTPERLAASGDRAASTVRYHFGGTEREDGTRDLGFARRDLTLEVIRLGLEHGQRAIEEVLVAWEATVDEVASTGSLDPVRQALADLVAAFVPGGSIDDSGPRDRARHLAYAVADDDPEVARILREARARQIDVWTEAVEMLLAATGRTMANATGPRDLADALFTITDGHLTRLRVEPTFAETWFSDLVVKTFEGFTQA